THVGDAVRYGAGRGIGVANHVGTGHGDLGSGGQRRAKRGGVSTVAVVHQRGCLAVRASDRISGGRVISSERHHGLIRHAIRRVAALLLLSDTLSPCPSLFRSTHVGDAVRYGAGRTLSVADHVSTGHSHFTAGGQRRAERGGIS